MRFVAILLILMLAWLANAWAEQATLPQLTLREAIARGLERNHQGRAARFQAEAARSGATAAALHYLPSITLEEGWTRSNLPVTTFMLKLNQGRFTNQDLAVSRLNDPAPVNDFKSAVTVEQPLFMPEAWAARRGARYGAEQQEALAQQTREQVAFSIFQHYLAVQQAKALLQATQKALEEARESRRQAAVRVKAGLGLKSDELRAETHLAIAEQQAISSINNLTLARMQLALAMGGQSGEQVDADGAVALHHPGQQPELLVQRAQHQRRDLLASERGKDQADAALLQSRAAFLPTIGAFGSWQMNDHSRPLGQEHDAWQAGVSLRWNLFDGFRTWHGSSQALALRSAAAEQLAQTRKEVSFQVHEAWLRQQEAEKRLTVARSAVAAAEEATRLLAKRFDNALATMLELLDAQSALNQARANLVESETALTLATGRVYYAAGLFLKEVQQ
jgi:outer membrane protein TolC